MWWCSRARPMPHRGYRIKSGKSRKGVVGWPSPQPSPTGEGEGSPIGVGEVRVGDGECGGVAAPLIVPCPTVGTGCGPVKQPRWLAGVASVGSVPALVPCPMGTGCPRHDESEGGLPVGWRWLVEGGAPLVPRPTVGTGSRSGKSGRHAKGVWVALRFPCRLALPGDLESMARLSSPGGSFLRRSPSGRALRRGEKGVGGDGCGG